MTAVLEVAGLAKRYGALVVTDGVSLRVEPGSIHALIGPNGAGKTSLVHQIGGTVRPDAGRIRLDGQDITHLPAHRRALLGLARGFQITSVLPEFTPLGNVALAVQGRSGSSFRFLRPAARDPALNRPALAALAALGLEPTDAPAASLSHGDKRRLELAMALAAEPRLLLLDEPLAGAGPEETARLIALLDGLRGRDMGTLLVEHDMQAVFALADTITVLVQGRVIASGKPSAIRADPAVQAAYLGEIG